MFIVQHAKSLQQLKKKIRYRKHKSQVENIFFVSNMLHVHNLELVITVHI